MDIFEKCNQRYIQDEVRDLGIYPYFHALESRQDTEVIMEGKRRGKVRVAKSNREVVLSRIRQEQMDFNQDIFLLVANFNNQAQQLDIAEEADVIAEKRYKTSVETFMIGKISTLDLNDAQNSKDEARQKHISELYYYWYYFYQLRSLTLWDFERDTELEADFEEVVRG